MRIAIFQIRNTFAGWYSVGGNLAALQRMGHNVREFSLPGNVPHAIEKVRAGLPSAEELWDFDAVLLFNHEYVQPWLTALYPFEEWSKILEKVAARYDESMDRADLNLPARLPELKRWATYHCFPAAQDATRYGGIWLPFGADLEMFRPAAEPKKYDTGFVGSLYASRMAYLKALSEQPGNDGVNFICGEVGMKELGGFREPESTRMLAEAYRSIKVFFCLPTASRLFPAKAFDVMACGTFVMMPRLSGDASENMTLFENNRHIIYYDPGYTMANGKQIKRWLKDTAGERESIARAGCTRVHAEFSIERILGRMLALVAKPVEMETVGAAE